MYPYNLGISHPAPQLTSIRATSRHTESAMMSWYWSRCGRVIAPRTERQTVRPSAAVATERGSGELYSLLVFQVHFEGVDYKSVLSSLLPSPALSLLTLCAGVGEQLVHTALCYAFELRSKGAMDNPIQQSCSLSLLRISNVREPQATGWKQLSSIRSLQTQ